MTTVKPKPNQDLLSLALEHRVPPEAIAAHPDNAAHARSRSASVLHQDDAWTIPEMPPKQHSFNTGQRVTFVYKPATRQVHLVLRDDQGKLLEVEYALKLRYTAEAPPRQPAEIHGYARHGVVDAEISAYVAKVVLVLYLDKAKPLEMELQVARLDPVTTMRGLKARLYALGVYRGPVDDEYDDGLRRSVWTFQMRHGLAATGLPDPATLSASEKAHGA